MLNILILQLNKHRTSNENGKYHRIFESSTDLDRKQIFLSIIYNDLNSNSYFIYDTLDSNAIVLNLFVCTIYLLAFDIWLFSSAALTVFLRLIVDTRYNICFLYVNPLFT